MEETVEHVLKKCKACKKERRILKEELQAVGYGIIFPPKILRSRIKKIISMKPIFKKARKNILHNM